MTQYDLKPGLNLMSIGFNCYLTILEDRIRGPFDNVGCISTKHLSAILDKTYLSTISDKNNVKYVPGPNDGVDYKIVESLGLIFVYNEYDSHFLKNQAKRVKNLENFIDKVKTDDNYYFIAYMYEESMSEECKAFLEKEGLIDKTIIFSHSEKVCDFFKNSVYVEASENEDTRWSLTIIHQLIDYFKSHGYKTKWWDDIVSN